MKKLIVAIALAAALGVAGPTASAHDEEEAVLQELTENCVACCLGMRPSLRERLELNEARCVEVCSSWAVWVFELLE